MTWEVSLAAWKVVLPVVTYLARLVLILVGAHSPSVCYQVLPLQGFRSQLILRSQFVVG